MDPQMENLVWVVLVCVPPFSYVFFAMLVLFCFCLCVRTCSSGCLLRFFVGTVVCGGFILLFFFFSTSSCEVVLFCVSWYACFFAVTFCWVILSWLVCAAAMVMLIIMCQILVLKIDNCGVICLSHNPVHLVTVGRLPCSVCGTACCLRICWKTSQIQNL